MTLKQQTPGPLEAFEVVFQDDPISQDEQTPLTLSVALGQVDGRFRSQ
ncbi:MAG: hypothetical protein ACK50G_00685 [bacterium]